MTKKKKFQQMIYFGSPGCGKSFRVRVVGEEIGVQKDSPNMIETTFHPEYSYGDFVAKLLPKTAKKENGTTQIEYHIHAGPLLKALARAYADLDQPVLLVIDEINRGNCAQIFGDIFQLLDRDDKGWSEYAIDPSDLIMDALQELLKNENILDGDNGEVQFSSNVHDKLKVKGVEDYKLRLPPNLSVIGTMNTSDESVYYMDTAFKRRWDFEHMPWEGMNDTPELQKNAMIEGTECTWYEFLKNLNGFIAAKFKGRNVDDKQVGIWFLKVDNLTQLPELIERGRKLEVLLEKLENLKGYSGLVEWKKTFHSALPFTNIADEKRLKCESIKNELHESYGLDSNEFDFEKAPSELAHNLIKFIKKKYPDEDKPFDKIARALIRNKLMFFIWDNVFSRDRSPLYELIKMGDSTNHEPRTFGDFCSDENVNAFINGVITWGVGSDNIEKQ